MVISDHKEGRFQSEIYGYIQKLSDNNKISFYFITSVGDCLTIKDLINAAGYTPESLKERKLIITIEDEK